MGKSRSRSRNDTSSDYGRLKDAFRKLQAENKKLRKENAQLRKQFNKTISQFDSWDSKEEVVELDSKKEKCQKCKSENTTQINTQKFLITVCNNCGSKKKKELS